MRLSNVHEYTLCALIDGATLKAHRYLDGAKLYKLHPIEGPAEPVERETVEYLKKHRLIKSNMKFPAATYLLTEKGKTVALSAAELRFQLELSPKTPQLGQMTDPDLTD